MITEFELFLLAKMRATDMVDEVLRNEGMSRGELNQLGKGVAEKWGLEQLGYNAKVFSEMIGAPVFERILSSADIDPPFVGSIQRVYRLELWSKVLFSAYQHPIGYAWGERFISRTEDQLLFLPNVKPWEFVVQSFDTLAQKIEVLDHWNHQKELRLSFLTRGSSKTCIALFDFDLLQVWKEEKC